MSGYLTTDPFVCGKYRFNLLYAKIQNCFSFLADHFCFNTVYPPVQKPKQQPGFS